MVWLEQNKDQQYQIELVKKLASAEYMNTNLQNGTSVWNLITGVDKYAIEKWHKYKRLEYRGWGKAPDKFRRTTDKAPLDWMQQGLHKNGAVWVNIGWYKREALNYRRADGHWVTLVGYERNKLVIHDPGSNKALRNQLVEVALLTAGELIGEKHKTTAANHLAILNGMRISPKGDLGIIDGAIVFEL